MSLRTWFPAALLLTLCGPALTHPKRPLTPADLRRLRATIEVCELPRR